ncbi:MAG: RibD family protein [Gemmatimonadota bacterium]
MISSSWANEGAGSDDGASFQEIFHPLRTSDQWVVGQIAQSLDGRIATESGHSHYVTGPTDIRRLHQLRALAQAVVVGAGTVAMDDPRLTVREVKGENPVRVVLDPSGRLDPHRRLFHDGDAPTLVVRRGDGPSLPGVETVRVADWGPAGFPPQAILRELKERGLRRVLVEGGGLTVSRFLQVQALDRLHLVVAPIILGSGRMGITLDPIRKLDEALRPGVRRFLLGADILFDLDFRTAGEEG